MGPIIRKIRFQIKIWTSALREDPSFMVIGTQKGGTTSLWNYLCQNPRVGRALKKEINYYNEHYAKKEKWYKAHFPLKGKAENLLYFDDTPEYMTHPSVPQRIHKSYPDMKFIVLLRNPVDRAYSHYQHRCRRQNENRTFEAALSELYANIDASTEMQDVFDNRYVYSMYYNYLARGHYAEQLTRWFQYFPREQFLIIQSEDFYAHTQEKMKEICDFVGITHWENTTYEIRNSGRVFLEIDPHTRQQLVAYFKPHNEKLYQLLGTNYGWE